MPPTEDETPGGIYVALGRIEKGQEYTNKALDEVKAEVGGVVKVLGEHAVQIGALRAWKESVERTLEERKPQRIPWTAIGAFVIAAVALFRDLFPIGS
ncbi:hypothetical protein [Agromyces larvae]|uniref:DUF3618 domain-containing protein n=1 Tax=Agromyces larvae TaxID=2929802 RepID=A0ABY4C7B7_9MICO|nr:hypothetical protein [Agromyces larvae]UOE45898.1 hypothetical protein MTO99_09205 [Agromyces larvae]